MNFIREDRMNKVRWEKKGGWRYQVCMGESWRKSLASAAYRDHRSFCGHSSLKDKEHFISGCASDLTSPILEVPLGQGHGEEGCYGIEQVSLFLMHLEINPQILHY